MFLFFPLLEIRGIIPLIFIFFSCINNDEVNNTPFKAHYLPLDTLISIDENKGVITFSPDFLKYENDFFVLKYSDENFEQSVIVPVKNNATNHYLLVDSSQGKIPLILNHSIEGVMKDVYLNFAGNNYLTKYNNFINSISDSAEIFGDPENWVERLFDFSAQTNFSQISGYLLNNAHGVFQNNKALTAKIEKFSCEQQGIFFDEICPTKESYFSMTSEDCIEHSLDTIVFQNDESTIIYPEYYKDHVIVLTF